MEKQSASALRCPECGGEFAASDLLDGDSIVTCINCGRRYSTSEILRKSSEVEAEEIRSSAYRDAEHERTEAYREAEAERTRAYRDVEHEKRKVEYERIKLDYQRMKNQDKKEKREKTSKVLKVVLPIFLLIVICVTGLRVLLKDNRDYTTTTFEWPERGLFLLLPQPETNNGAIINESEQTIYFELYNSTRETFDSYTKLCFDSGFSEDYYKSDTIFCAENADGYSIDIYYDKKKNIIEVTFNSYYIPIAVGYSYDDFEGMQYLDAKALLEEKGFTNIKTQEDGWNLFKKTGEVKSITIKGNNEFLSLDKFLKDDEIIIYYYK